MNWVIGIKNTVIILFLTAIAAAVFHFTNISCPILFFLIPTYFIIVSIFLAVFIKNNPNEKRTIIKMLLFRFSVVFGGIIVVLFGAVFDKKNIIGFVILFIIYYVVFSVFETQAMIKKDK